MTGQILKANWYRYAADGNNPSTPCDTGEYYYFYDALGNVIGVQQEGYYSGAPTNFYRWEMDAFGNPLSGANDFLAMDQPGPKEHLTGKMYDTATGLYYFHARWYDPEVGRFLTIDPESLVVKHPLSFLATPKYAAFLNSPISWVDPTGYSIFDPEQALSAMEYAVRNAVREKNLEPWGNRWQGCGEWNTRVVIPALREVDQCAYECAECRGYGIHIVPVHIFTICRKETESHVPWHAVWHRAFNVWRKRTFFTKKGYFSRSTTLFPIILKWPVIVGCEKKVDNL